MILSRLGIKGKMFTFGLFLSVITLAVGAAGYYTVARVSAPYEHVVSESVPDLTTATNLLSSLRLARSHLRSLAIADLTAEDQKLVHASLQKGIAQVEAGLKAFEKLHARNSELNDDLKAATKIAANENQIFKSTANLDPANRAERAQIDTLVHQDIVLAPTVAVAFEKIAELYIAENAASVATAQKNHSDGIVLLFTLMGFSVLTALGSAYLFARSMSNVFLRISEELAGSAHEVSAASQQISQASQQLSSGATEAAASLEETVASIEELSSVVKLNATHAADAALFSNKTHASAESGDGELRKLVVAVSDISQSSKKIEEIINVIDDIAFQTNLLALNAAVEAARAGEQGKGFAVVAEAVRSLAQRSSAAAKDITSLIKESVSRADHGGKLADRSGTVLKEIVSSVQKITSLNSEIASGSREQSTGLSQISQAMNQLDQATQGNAASAEEVAATSEEMAQQADAMHELVRDLRTLIHGASANDRERQISNAPHSTRSRATVKSAQTKAGLTKSPLKLTTQNPFSVSPLRASPAGNRSPASTAAQAIPFDDDEPSFAKVGTTDGF